MNNDFFRDSADLDVLYKILNWGPENVGKTHFLLSAGEVTNGVAIIDFENRASQFRDRFTFKHAVPKGVREGIAMLEAISAGKLNVGTIGVDSLTKPYLAYVKMFTETKRSQAGNEYQATDYAAVNRAMLTQFVEPLFAIKGKHIICSARQTTDLLRDKASKDFTNRGVKINGDGVRWRYDYDYVLHWVTRGLVKVEKSMSEHLPVESEIYGDLDFARFIRLVTGQEDVRATPREGARRAPRPAADRVGATPAVAPTVAREAPPPIATEAPPQDDTPVVKKLDELLVHIEAGPTRSIFALAKAKQIDDYALVARIVQYTGGAPLAPDAYADFVAAMKAA